MNLVYCVDFGSTFTKAALVDVDTGSLVANGSHPTTMETDVLDGWEAIKAELSPRAGDSDVPVLACSSAGGGLRIAVVGNEELVTAEAGRRVALSSGGKVVHVSYDDVDIGALGDARPDVVLLVGGTDGGNSEVLLRNARALSSSRWSTPVVVAGNEAAADDVVGVLSGGGVEHVLADNVVPRIGTLEPASARAAIRAMFLEHVIGGKHLSKRADFVAMVQGATPDLVLSAVELLANGLGDESRGVGDVVVVDVGGATTDVHSVVAVDDAGDGLSREVVATVPVSRTVEGDLGMRWSAVSTVEAARADGFPVPAGLAQGVEQRHRHPEWLPVDEGDEDMELRLAALAVALAVRRHAGRQRVAFGPDGRLVERTGKDLREVGLLVGSGGVLRHAPKGRTGEVLAAATGHHDEGGWLMPRAPRLVVDSDYVLAAAGLLAAEHPAAALTLMSSLPGS